MGQSSSPQCQRLMCRAAALAHCDCHPEVITKAKEDRMKFRRSTIASWSNASMPKRDSCRHHHSGHRQESPRRANHGGRPRWPATKPAADSDRSQGRRPRAVRQVSGNEVKLDGQETADHEGKRHHGRSHRRSRRRRKAPKRQPISLSEEPASAPLEDEAAIPNPSSSTRPVARLWI